MQYYKNKITITSDRMIVILMTNIVIIRVCEFRATIHENCI